MTAEAVLLAQPVADPIVTKGQFAELIGVSPGRVSQMIAEGKIGPEALVGEGRSAKIRIETARAQLRERTDLGQRLGNGLTTRLDGALSLVADAQLTDRVADDAPRLAGAEDGLRQPSPTQPSPGPSDPVADRLKQLKLNDAERRERQALEDDLARRGVYVRADHSRVALLGVAQSMLNVFDGAVADLAQALATHFEIPQRDLAHVLRQEFRALRSRAAAAARQKAEELPLLIIDDGSADLAEEATQGEEG
ncbi:hypothetical protein [Brevundimonas bacteroides]|uniref:hypothetical protein n=1 Tax=Brevundimonas bacteroides TaxID=74311 RepID=UPI000689565D|nr:hypothetical protein [Brevundimonas bacteroides]